MNAMSTLTSTVRSRGHAFQLAHEVRRDYTAVRPDDRQAMYRNGYDSLPGRHRSFVFDHEPHHTRAFFRRQMLDLINDLCRAHVTIIHE